MTAWLSLAQALGHESRGQVRNARRRKWHDEADRAGRVGLGGAGRCRYGQGEKQRQTDAHHNLPNGVYLFLTPNWLAVRQYRATAPI